MEKNVIVTDEFGTQVGVTYPKRAEGLVKKGRAEYVNDYTIRLRSLCPSDENQEDFFYMTQKIYFNAKEWRPNPAAPEGVYERTFITDMSGNLAEIYMLGDWDWHWSEICTKLIPAEKDTDYTFTFWLNGGECDIFKEVCQLQIVFTDGNCMEAMQENWANRGISKDEYEERSIYKLNRSMIKPIKKFRGWELYEIPFHTDEKEYFQLRFVAQRAYMSIMPAKDKEAYADWADEPDVFEGQRPQRHNIIFEDGWPVNAWYSTESLKREAQKKNAATGAETMNGGSAGAGKSTEPKKGAEAGQFGQSKNSAARENKTAYGTKNTEYTTKKLHDDGSNPDPFGFAGTNGSSFTGSSFNSGLEQMLREMTNAAAEITSKLQSKAEEFTHVVKGAVQEAYRAEHMKHEQQMSQARQAAKEATKDFSEEKFCKRVENALRRFSNGSIRLEQWILSEQKDTDELREIFEELEAVAEDEVENIRIDIENNQDAVITKIKSIGHKIIDEMEAMLELNSNEEDSEELEESIDEMQEEIDDLQEEAEDKMSEAEDSLDEVEEAFENWKDELEEALEEAEGHLENEAFDLANKAIDELIRMLKDPKLM